MHFSGWIIGAALAAGVGVSSSGVNTSDGYRKQIETLRQGRVARLTAPKGWLTLVGLDWLKDGKNTVGSAADNAIVIAKADTELPSLPGVTVWVEPHAPSHPLVGLVHALEMAESRPVLVCAADLPFVTPRLVRRLASGMRGADAVVAGSGGEVQPLLGWYHPRALPVLRELDPTSGISLRDAVGRLRPVVVEVGDPQLLFNVNTPDDLLQAAAMLDARARGQVKG